MNFSLTGTMHTCGGGEGVRLQAATDSDTQQQRKKQGVHEVEGRQSHLTRRQPERPLSCRVLAQDRDHALEGTQHGTVHDDGAVGGLCAAA